MPVTTEDIKVIFFNMHVKSMKEMDKARGNIPV